MILYFCVVKNSVISVEVNRQITNKVSIILNSLEIDINTFVNMALISD